MKKKISIFVKAYLNSTKAFIRNTSLGFFGFMIAYIMGSASSSSNMDTEWLWIVWAVIIAFTGYVIRDIKEDESVEINLKEI